MHCGFSFSFDMGYQLCSFFFPVLIVIKRQVYSATIHRVCEKLLVCFIVSVLFV